MQATSIEWCDATWNPVTGCTKVSPGCKNCYAEKITERFGRKFTDIILHPDRLEQPLRWKKPRRIFVNSMSDLFHEKVPDEFIDQVFGVMGACEDAGQTHQFQILTKRAQRMHDYVSVRAHKAWNSRRLATEAFPCRNVWLGVSAEDQARADERIPLLLRTPAAVRFVSAEPLLGPIDFRRLWFPDKSGSIDALTGKITCKCIANGTGQEFWAETEEAIYRPLDWIIAGGESGPKARPCDHDWIRDLIRQCRVAAVPIFVKQMGSRPVVTDHFGQYRYDLEYKDRKGADPAEWHEDLRVREFPTVDRKILTHDPDDKAGERLHAH